MDGFKKAIVLLVFATFGSGLSTALLPIYLNSKGLSLISIGFVFAVGAIIASGIRFILGIFVDAYGKKPLLLLSIFGYIVFAIGLLFAESLGQFIFLKLLFDVSNIFFWTAFSPLFFDVLEKGEEGHGLGFRNAVLYAVLAFSPLIAGILAKQIGFNFLYVLSAFLSCIGLFFAAQINEKNQKHKANLKILKKFLKTEYLKLLKIPNLKYTTLAIVAIDFLFTFWLIYMPIWLSQNGFSLDEIGNLMFGYILLSAILQVSIGKAIDKFKINRIAIPGLLFIWFGSLAFFAFKNFLSILLSRMALGIGGDMAYLPFVAHLAKTCKKEIHGIATSFVFGLSGIFSGFAALLAGWLTNMFGIETILISVSMISLFLIPILLGKKI
ncbi:MAG: MFS transporter [Candidatus Nanoarchaeia archaeon]